jgi:hypothetical protein
VEADQVQLPAGEQLEIQVIMELLPLEVLVALEGLNFQTQVDRRLLEVRAVLEVVAGLQDQLVELGHQVAAVLQAEAAQVEHLLTI